MLPHCYEAFRPGIQIITRDQAWYKCVELCHNSLSTALAMAAKIREGG